MSVPFSLLLIVFVLVGAVASSINLSGGRTNFQQPMARITLESCEGGIYGVGPKQMGHGLKENQIVLMHEGGDPLPLDSISIRISGYGNSFQGNISKGSGKRIEGDVDVLYLDLSQREKIRTTLFKTAQFLKTAPGMSGKNCSLWEDSAIGTIESSVKASVDGDDKTSDNYGFKAGSEITLMVIDRKGRNVLAERTAIVKLAD